MLKFIVETNFIYIKILLAIVYILYIHICICMYMYAMCTYNIVLPITHYCFINLKLLYIFMI